MSRAYALPRESHTLTFIDATTEPFDLKVTPLAPAPVAVRTLVSASAGTCCKTGASVLFGSRSSTSHPAAQPPAGELHAPLLEGHTVTPAEVLRLTASLRARFKLIARELIWPVSRSFCTKLLNAGMPIAAKIPATTIATSNSMMVNPRATLRCSALRSFRGFMGEHRGRPSLLETCAMSVNNDICDYALAFMRRDLDYVCCALTDLSMRRQPARR